MATVQRIDARAEREAADRSAAELRRVPGQEAILYGIAEAALANPDGLVRDDVYRARTAPQRTPPTTATGMLRTQRPTPHGSRQDPQLRRAAPGWEVISNSLVASPVHHAVGERVVEKQQMRWSLEGAQLLLQIRIRALNGDLAEDFHRWHPNATHQDSDGHAIAA